MSKWGHRYLNLPQYFAVSRKKDYLELDGIDVANCLQSDIIVCPLHKPVRKGDVYKSCALALLTMAIEMEKSVLPSIRDDEYSS